MCRCRGLEATFTAVFGPRDLAVGVGRRIRWIHDFVTGPSYRANDPENLLWVHATLLDTALRCCESLVRPLPPDERETYYQEMTEVAELLGCPQTAQPKSLADFEATGRRHLAAGPAREPARPAGTGTCAAPPPRHRLDTRGGVG